MDSICNTYEDLLTSHVVTDCRVNMQTVKRKIQHNIADAEFSHPVHNKLEQLCSVRTKDIDVGKAAASVDPRKVMYVVFECANVIRHDIMKARMQD